MITNEELNDIGRHIAGRLVLIQETLESGRTMQASMMLAGLIDVLPDPDSGHLEAARIRFREVLNG